MIVEGDCLAVMASMEPESIDAIVTDPPYGLEFMGKGWDSFRVDDPGTMRHRGERVGGQGTIKASNPTLEAAGRVEYGAGKRPTTSRCRGCGKRDQFRNPHGCPESGRDSAIWTAEPIDRYAAPPASLAFGEWCRTWALEAYRVAKPGAHLLSFGGTRTIHRLTCALEDAGWEIRDTLVWAYASGFPKSLDVSKAIDKAAGAEREVVGSRTVSRDLKRAGGDEGQGYGRMLESGSLVVDVTAPATPEAEAWQGWGTALKPAWEPIVLARKPLTGSVASNVLAHGTGALNIDGTRIPMADDDAERIAQMGGYGRADWEPTEAVALEGAVDGSLEHLDASANAAGRWPANVVLTDPIFDGDAEGVVGADTSGTYSRFFLIPKAARGDREPIVGGQLDAHAGHLTMHSQPTGILGSGSTGIAAELEGFAWIGIEREPEYVAIAHARLEGTQRGLGLDVGAPTSKRSNSRSHWPAKRGPHAAEGWGFTSGQLGLDERTEGAS